MIRLWSGATSYQRIPSTVISRFNVVNSEIIVFNVGTAIHDIKSLPNCKDRKTEAPMDQT